MRIGIDIDGVLTDLERAMYDYGTKFCYEHKLPIDLKLGFYNEQETFNWSEEQAEQFWNEYLIDYATVYPARAFAAEVIQKLKQEGNYICIITARNDYRLIKENYGKMQDFVKQWLKDNNIYYDKLIFTKGSKLPYAQENQIDVMIDDSPENIIDISKEIPVICFHSTYNSQVEGENITRAYAWYDIYDKIKTIAFSSLV